MLAGAPPKSSVRRVFKDSLLCCLCLPCCGHTPLHVQIQMTTVCPSSSQNRTMLLRCFCYWTVKFSVVACVWSHLLLCSDSSNDWRDSPPAHVVSESHRRWFNFVSLLYRLCCNFYSRVKANVFMFAGRKPAAAKTSVKGVFIQKIKFFY